jgi:HEAT repeat protein
MAATTWKISTFVAMAAAGFLALHPLGNTTAEKDPEGAAKANHHASGGLWGYLMGATSSPDHSPAAHTGTHLQALRDARNQAEECEALHALRDEATGDEEAIAEIADRASPTHRRGTRICAVEALENIPTGAARSHLINLMNDGDRTVREWAMRALATKARDDAAALSAMTAAAHSEDRDVRLAAIIALGEAHVPEASALIQDAAQHETGEMQSRLIDALGQTHDPAAVAMLTKVLDDGSRTSRNAAIEALGNIGGAAALQALQDKLQGGNREDMYGAARALAATGDPAARQTLIDAASTAHGEQQIAALHALSQTDGDAVRAVMLQGLRASDGQVVSVATNWFSQHADQSAVPELTALLKTAPSQSHSAIVGTLANIGGDAARDALAAVARTPGADQGYALNHLMNMPGGRDDARKIALKMAKEGGVNVGTAISVLGQDGSSEAREALVTLAHGGGDSAPSAINALVQRGDADSMRAAYDLARNGKTASLRSNALSAIGATGDPKAAPLLLLAAHDKDASIRTTALGALGRMGGDAAERALIDGAHDGDISTRATAIGALGRLHTTSARAELEKLATSDDAQTAATAYGSLVGAAPDRAAALADRSMATGSTTMRQTIVSYAYELPHDDGKRILVGALHDADDSVAETAVAGLASMAGVDAQQALLDVLSSDATANVKRAAADALERSGGDLAHDHSGLIDRYKSVPVSGEGASEVREDDLE